MGVWKEEGKIWFPYIQLAVSSYSRVKNPDCGYLLLFVGVRIGGREKGVAMHNQADQTRVETCITEGISPVQRGSDTVRTNNVVNEEL